MIKVSSNSSSKLIWYIYIKNEYRYIFLLYILIHQISFWFDKFYYRILFSFYIYQKQICTKHITERKLELRLTSELNKYAETWYVMSVYNKYICYAFRLYVHFLYICSAATYIQITDFETLVYLVSNIERSKEKLCHNVITYTFTSPISLLFYKNLFFNIKITMFSKF